MANIPSVPSKELNFSYNQSQLPANPEASTPRANHQLAYENYLLGQITSLESRLVSLTQSKNRTTQQAGVFFEMFLDNVNQAITSLERATEQAKKCDSDDISMNDRALLDTVLLDLEKNLDEQLSFPLLGETLQRPQTPDEAPLELSLLSSGEARRALNTLSPLLTKAKEQKAAILVKIEQLKTQQQ